MKFKDIYTNEELIEFGLKYLEAREARRRGTANYYNKLTDEQKTKRAKHAVCARIKKGTK